MICKSERESRETEKERERESERARKDNISDHINERVTLGKYIKIS